MNIEIGRSDRIPLLMRRQQVIAVLGISHWTLDKMVRSGVVEVIKIKGCRGLYRKTDIEKAFGVKL